MVPVCQAGTMSDQAGAGGEPAPAVEGAPGDEEEDSVKGRELPSVGRLLSLTDGVVAIAITLIIFQLKVPSLPAGEADSPAHLAHALGQLGPEVVTYIVAFYVIAQFWLAHHRVFRLVRGHDEGLSWVNFAFLLTITAMPFTANLIGVYGGNPVAIDVFGFNLILASLATSAVVLYGRRRHLMVPDVRRGELAAGTRRSLAVLAVVGTSMAVAWVSTTSAKYLWFGLVLVGVLGRHEARSAAADPAAP